MSCCESNLCAAGGATTTIEPATTAAATTAQTWTAAASDATRTRTGIYSLYAERRQLQPIQAAEVTSASSLIKCATSCLKTGSSCQSFSFDVEEGSCYLSEVDVESLSLSSVSTSNHYVVVES
ncbi:uncharacterized protein [Diadema setosum]|uniref:uncharacterized protein n=1 Tax=Diadema setosum TaxID=31175 RepID=UPI003B3B411A